MLDSIRNRFHELAASMTFAPGEVAGAVILAVAALLGLWSAVVRG